MSKHPHPIKALGETETRFPKSSPIGSSVLNPYDKINQLEDTEFLNRKNSLSQAMASEHYANVLSASRESMSGNPIVQSILDGLVKPNQVLQTISPPDVNFDGDVLGTLSNKGFAQNLQMKSALEAQLAEELLLERIRKEVDFMRPYNRTDLDRLTIKQPWFNKLSLPEQLMYKQAIFTNRAQTFNALELEAPTDWLVPEFSECVQYLPRYSTGRLQPVNLVLLDTSDRLQCLSAYIPQVDYDVVYVRYWAAQKNWDVYCRWCDGQVNLVRLDHKNGRVQCEVMNVETTVGSEILRVYGNVFRWRYMQYEQAVAKRVPKRNVTALDEIQTEALKLYSYDLTVPEPENRDAFIVTMSDALPKLGRYQGPLSVPTGRKMPPHDRQPHFSYRYNADGSVRIKFPVRAAEVNGGAKARNGLQISKLKEIK